MWTSEWDRQTQVREAEAEVGLVTLGGDPAGVNLGGERRWLPVYSPGGYAWRPAAGDKVLVVKAGGEREAPCILGKVQDGTDLAPGEVRLTGTGSSLVLREGSVRLNGAVQINGIGLDAYIREIAADMLAQQEA